MNSYKILTILILILTLFSTSGFAATCRDGVAEGNEQCDENDFRGYTCPTLCYLDTSNPQDYNANLPYDGQYSCLDYGHTVCNSDCTFSSTSCHGPMCGDGILQGNEACDDGDMNSDTEADACRTDCTNPNCGDGIADSNEACDAGSYNSDAVPDACRTDCQYAYCGDNVVDFANGEECDNGVNDGSNGCYQCNQCYKPSDNLHLSYDAKLCSGTYTIADEGEEGVLIVDGSGMTLDCNGAKLIGVQVGYAQAQQTTNADMGMASTTFNQNDESSIGQVNTQTMGSQTQESSGWFSQAINYVAQMFTGSSEEEANPPDLSGNSASTRNDGTGIYVTGWNVNLVGCDVSTYAYGVKFDSGSESVLANSKVCDNTKDIDAAAYENYGAKNTCGMLNVVNWKENGVIGCAFSCDGSVNTETDCPETVCEECPECEETVEDEPEEVVEEVIEETTTEEETVDLPEETVIECPTGQCLQGYDTYGNLICGSCEEDEVVESCDDDECLQGYDIYGDLICGSCDDEEETVEDEEDIDEEEEEETTEEAEVETTGDECVDKYLAEGYTKEEAEKYCTEEETKSSEGTQEASASVEEVKETVTEEKKVEEEEKLTEEEQCIKDYEEKGYSEAEAKKYCTEEETETKEDTRTAAAVTGYTVAPIVADYAIKR